MATSQNNSLRNIPTGPRVAARRRVNEALVLAGMSLAFLFALAVTFGFISG
jgi:hypothetical protein